MSGSFDARAGAVVREVMTGIEGHADEIGRLDAVAGDGDLGVTVLGAIRAARSVLDAVGGAEPSPWPAVLRELGMAIADAAPSTSGTLVATGLLGAAREPFEGDDPVAEAGARLAAARTAIERRGKAVVGQKTMLDALAPAIDALTNAAGRPLSIAVRAAADAAAAGATATRDLEPGIGRASWLADRSRGNIDAGAQLVAVFFEEWANAITEPVRVAPPPSASPTG